MHELSVAQDILDIIRRNVSPSELENVRVVTLKVGEQAGIVSDSLEFSFRALTMETPLARAQLSILRIPYRLHCNTCNEILDSPFGLGICPKCSGTQTTVVSGTELQVATIDVGEPSLEVS